MQTTDLEQVSLLVNQALNQTRQGVKAPTCWIVLLGDSLRGAQLPILPSPFQLLSRAKPMPLTSLVQGYLEL